MNLTCAELKAKHCTHVNCFRWKVRQCGCTYQARSLGVEEVTESGLATDHTQHPLGIELPGVLQHPHTRHIACTAAVTHKRSAGIITADLCQYQRHRT